MQNCRQYRQNFMIFMVLQPTSKCDCCTLIWCRICLHTKYLQSTVKDFICSHILAAKERYVDIFLPLKRYVEGTGQNGLIDFFQQKQQVIIYQLVPLLSLCSHVWFTCSIFSHHVVFTEVTKPCTHWSCHVSYIDDGGGKWRMKLTHS